MKVVENSPQNARKCTISKKVLGGGHAPKPLNKGSQLRWNNRSIADHKEIADQFNVFFSNIGSTLSDSIPLL